MTPLERAKNILLFDETSLSEVDAEIVAKAIEEAVTDERERVYLDFANEIEASKGPNRHDPLNKVTQHCDELVKLAKKRVREGKKVT